MLKPFHWRTHLPSLFRNPAMYCPPCLRHFRKYTHHQTTQHHLTIITPTACAQQPNRPHQITQHQTKIPIAFLIVPSLHSYINRASRHLQEHMKTRRSSLTPSYIAQRSAQLPAPTISAFESLLRHFRNTNQCFNLLLSQSLAHAGFSPSAKEIRAQKKVSGKEEQLKTNS